MVEAMLETLRYGGSTIARLILLGVLLGACGGAYARMPEPAAPASATAPAPAPAAGLPEPAPYDGFAMADESAPAPASGAGPVFAQLAKGHPSVPAPAKPHAPGSAAPAPATLPGAATEPPPAATAQPPRREALLVYTATLVLAVYQVDVSLSRIEDLARTVGGYLASRTDTSIVVRVPRARFQEALGEVVKLGDVLHRDIEAQDVSDQVVDLEARLRNARAVRDRLAQLLQGASATKDALEIEKELARVMGEIEVMEGKLQLLLDKVAYSTVTVQFQPLRTSDVHAMARLPFPWLEDLGLARLLQVK
jgi:hypothetical protein